ncbi:MAG: thioesterase family protein [Bacteroidota bacterium]
MQPEPLRQPFEVEIAITPADIDQLDHVNNVVYLRWVQEAAIAHWTAAATDEEKDSLLWVIARHEIDYRRPAFRQDEAVIVRTWLGGTRGQSFERHTEILRAADRKLLAEARTFWRPIDPATMRPVAPSDDLYARFSTSDGG